MEHSHHERPQRMTPKAERELDARVAVEVMGLVPCDQWKAVEWDGEMTVKVLRVWFDSKGRERITLEIVEEETVTIAREER